MWWTHNRLSAKWTPTNFTLRYVQKNDYYISFPVTLIFDLLTSKLIPQLLVTRVIIQLNLSFLWLSSFKQMYDRWQIEGQSTMLNAASYEGPHNKTTDRLSGITSGKKTVLYDFPTQIRSKMISFMAKSSLSYTKQTHTTVCDAHISSSSSVYGLDFRLTL